MHEEFRAGMSLQELQSQVPIPSAFLAVVGFQFHPNELE